MGKYIHRLVAGALALSMLLGQGALASEALGWDLHAGTTALAQGVFLTRGYFWSDTYRDLRTERYISYTPGGEVLPTVAWGEDLFTESTLTDMARTLESQGMRVVGGANGDYYVVASGQPLGIVIRDGVLRSSSPAYYYAVGFRADGSAFVGTTALRITATLNGERVSVSGGLNKTRRLTSNEGGLLLVTRDLGTETKNAAAGVDVVLRPMTEALGEVLPGEENGAGEDLTLTDQVRIGGRVQCLVEAVYESKGPIEIPEGCMVLTMNGADDEAVLAKLRALQARSRVDIDVTATDPRWNEAVTAIGGLYRLLREGEVCTAPNAGDTTWTQQTARTAIGVKEDGTVIFYTIDGWLSKNSVGASLTQVAKRLKELGCVEAIALDGGGSTTLGATTAAQNAMAVVNKPRDGAQRKVTNAIFLTTQTPATGIPGSLQVEPEDALVLAGTTIPLTAYRLDTAFRRMGVSEGAAYTVEGSGTVTGGVFAAGPQAGTAVITATESVLVPAQGPTPSVIPEESEAPETGNPTPEVPETEDPVTETPETENPESEPPAAQAPETESPETEAPETETPETEAPEIEAVETEIPETEKLLTGTATVTVVATPETITLKNERTGAAVGDVAVEPGETVSLTAVSTWRNLLLRSEDAAYTWSCDSWVGTVDAQGTFTAGDVTAGGELRVTAGDKTLSVPVHVRGQIKLLEDMEGDQPPFASTDTVQARAETDLTRVKAGRQSLRLDYDGEEGEALLTAQVDIPAGERYMGLWVYGDGSGNGLEADFAVPATQTTPEETDPTGIDLPQTETVTLPLTTLDFSGWKHILVALPQDSESLTGLRVTAGEGTIPAGTVWLDHMTVANEALEDVTAPAVKLSVEGNILSAQVSDDLDRSFDGDRVWAQYDGQSLTGSWDAAQSRFTAVLPEEDGGAHRITVVAQDQSGNLGRGSYDRPGTDQAPFLDTEGHWAAAYADYLYQQGVASGVEVTGGLIYRPNANITRVEFSAMVARWLGLDLSAYEEVELPFADLAEIPAWAIPALKAMYAEGIVVGSRDGELLRACPNDEISRVEVMTILGRTQQKGWQEADLTAFSDGDRVQSWAEVYVRGMVGQGVITGFEDGTLGPAAPMTRGQVARVLYALR